MRRKRNLQKMDFDEIEKHQHIGQQGGFPQLFDSRGRIC